MDHALHSKKAARELRLCQEFLLRRYQVVGVIFWPRIEKSRASL